MELNMEDDRWHYPRAWSVGVDIGQAHDPTAICVVEAIRAEGIPGDPRLRGVSKPRPVYNVRHLERLKLGLTYPAQVSHVCGLVARPGLVEREPSVWVDYTGVGRPVFDLFKDARVPNLRGVTITSGRDVSYNGSHHSVPKVLLVSKLQSLLHAGELKIAAGLADAPALLRELQEFRVKFTDAGNATWNAREGQHDDLVLALALAVYGVSNNRTASVEPLRYYPIMRNPR